MTTANLIMAAIGLVALVAGLAVLISLRAGSDPARRTRRLMFGTMSVALGLLLSIFAIGLSHGAAR